MHTAAHVATILIVEDHTELVALLERVLIEHGYDVRSARDGDAGLASAIENEPDLVILDVGVPRRNGLEVVQELRRHGVHAPALMLTAHAEVSDRVAGLNAGADDYLTKPFDTDELVARIKALLRRSNGGGHVPRLCVGDIELDPLARSATRGGRNT